VCRLPRQRYELLGGSSLARNFALRTYGNGCNYYVFSRLLSQNIVLAFHTRSWLCGRSILLLRGSAVGFPRGWLRLGALSSRSLYFFVRPAFVPCAALDATQARLAETQLICLSRSLYFFVRPPPLSFAVQIPTFSSQDQVARLRLQSSRVPR